MFEGQGLTGPAGIGLDEFVNRSVDPLHDVEGAERLRDEVGGAALDRVNRHGDAAVRRRHQDRRHAILVAWSCRPSLRV